MQLCFFRPCAGHQRVFKQHGWTKQACMFAGVARSKTRQYTVQQIASSDLCVSLLEKGGIMSHLLSLPEPLLCTLVFFSYFCFGVQGVYRICTRLTQISRMTGLAAEAIQCPTDLRHIHWSVALGLLGSPLVRGYCSRDVANWIHRACM